MDSEAALKLYAMQREGTIKSNADFWRNHAEIQSYRVDLLPYIRERQGSSVDLVCALDGHFPQINLPLRMWERPYLFAYRGDLSLLNDISHNVAVIGVLNPSQEVVARERKIVRELTARGSTIVSGLAWGCDTVAHRECLACNGKTVAFLPTPLSEIYPKENAELAERIIENGGLVITEYMAGARTRQEGVGRFIARDRLQAMFAGRIILIASYLKGEGDSGSRHAMEKAKEYGRERFVMYRPSDAADPQFGLNRKILQEGGVVFTPAVLERFTF